MIDTGQLEKSIVMIDRAIHLAKSGDNLVRKARAYSYKGIVLQTGGDLDGAEEMYKKSLEIANEVGFKHIIEVIDNNLKLLKNR